MRASFIVSLAASIAAAVAQGNAFTYPISNVTIEAGSTMNIEWANATGSTVTLLLMNGDPNNLQTYATIGTSIPNQGSVAWSIPTSIPTGDYAFELVNNDNKESINYSSFFHIDNPTASSVTSVSATSETVGSVSANSTSAATSAPVTSAVSTQIKSSSAVPVPVPVSTQSSGNSTSAASASHATTTSASAGAGVNGTNPDHSASSKSKTAAKTSPASTSAGSSSSSSSSGSKNAAVVASWSVAGMVGAIGAAAFML